MAVRTGSKVPFWMNALLVGGTLVILLVLEKRRPLRREVEPKARHDGRNLAIAALAAATVQLAERPAVEPLTRWIEARQLGLLKVARLPLWAETLLAVLLLDYTLYLWHVATHKVPFLWRFHLPHHVDLDCTASTALRFHAGELALSIAWRSSQVLAIGVSPLALSVWQLFTLLEIMFHHSNVELPPEMEQRLSKLIVTPRLHGIHHSIVPEEMNSNWSSGLAIWDWLHGTLRADVPQEAITIGVPARRSPKDVTFLEVLAMPFSGGGATPGGSRTTVDRRRDGHVLRDFRVREDRSRPCPPEENERWPLRP